nr:hypothetical protein [uncultured Desulfobacter sp.]
MSKMNSSMFPSSARREKPKLMNPAPTLSKNDLVLNAIQELREDDLTKNYLIPLFKTIGYTKVEYHGGPYEEGKDIMLEV